MSDSLLFCNGIDAVTQIREAGLSCRVVFLTMQRDVSYARRAMEAGAIRQGDPFQVASALWACDHGLASLEYRTPAGARSERTSGARAV